MAKVGIEATKAQIEKAVEVTDGSIITGENSVALKGTASGDSSVAIGNGAEASGGLSTALWGMASGDSSIAIGEGSDARGEGSIQLGRGINADDSTLQVGEYQLLNAGGKIPDGRVQSTINGTTKTVTEWLTQVINASGGKPISSITVDNQGRIKITYTDGTYTQSDRYIASKEGLGFARLSNYMTTIGSRGAIAPHFDFQSAQTATGRRDSANAEPGESSPGSHASIVRLQDIDQLVVKCLIDNWVYGDNEEAGQYPIDPADKAKIASLLGYMLSSDVITALAGKQNTLTFDTSPTEDSSNPVTSGGVYTAIETAVGDIDTALTGLISGGGVV